MIDEAHLKPNEGNFNTSEIEKFILDFTHAFRDPLDSEGLFYLAGNDVTAKFARNTRIDNPDEGHPYGICLIDVHPQNIRLSLLGSDESLVMARKFLQWLLKKYSCQVRDGWGNDLTEECADSLDAIFADDDDDDD